MISQLEKIESTPDTKYDFWKNPVVVTYCCLFFNTLTASFFRSLIIMAFEIGTESGFYGIMCTKKGESIFFFYFLTFIFEIKETL